MLRRVLQAAPLFAVAAAFVPVGPGRPLQLLSVEACSLRTGHTLLAWCSKHAISCRTSQDRAPGPVFKLLILLGHLLQVGARGFQTAATYLSLPMAASQRSKTCDVKRSLQAEHTMCSHKSAYMFACPAYLTQTTAAQS